MNKKRICSVVQEYFPKDIRIRKQTETLIKNNFSVSVICLRNKWEKKHEVIDGVEIYRLNLSKKRASIFRYILEYFLFFILAFIKLNILDLKKRFNIVQVNNLPDFLVFSTIIQKLKGSKIVLDMHEIMPEFFMSKYNKSYSSFIIKLLKIIEKISLRFSSEVITINEPIKEIFQRRAIPNKEITIVMNTVDETVYPKMKLENDGYFNLVYHGTLSEIYGLDLAIQALKEFTKNDNQFRFYIFGEGPQRDYLRTLIESNNLQKSIFLMGQVPFEEIMFNLKKMTIGILPIRKDIFLDLSFSNKLAEYIYLKIPVIISNLNATQYYFSDDEITYFNAGDIKDLYKNIYFAYKNPETMREKAERAFQRYQSIRWSVMADRYLKLMNTM